MVFFFNHTHVYLLGKEIANEDHRTIPHDAKINETGIISCTLRGRERDDSNFFVIWNKKRHILLSLTMTETNDYEYILNKYTKKKNKIKIWIQVSKMKVSILKPW